MPRFRPARAGDADSSGEAGLDGGARDRATSRALPLRSTAMTALYRKYRPQDFGQVVGQEAVVRTLRNAIEHDQVRQAYLFAGPRGTGKTSMARILAKALNARRRPDGRRPTTTATPASRSRTARSLDVIEMDAASQRGIDDIREIRERVVLQPAEGGYKVYILDEAHQLTDAAWNALLKLIEEPPPHLVFVFCTTDLAEGAADRALALPDVRLPAAAAAGARDACCAASATARRSRRPTPRSR